MNQTTLSMNTAILLLGALGAGLIVAPVSAADVKSNWKTHCAKCHGNDGSGKTPTGRKLGVKNYRDAKVQESLTERDMIKATRGGLRDKDRELMKPFGSVLSDTEIRELIAYIRSFGPKK